MFGSDLGKASEKNGGFDDEKKGAVIFEAPVGDQLPPYTDHPDIAEADSIHHPADKDDILTHTIHFKDDPTLNAVTFRTIFLGVLSPVFTLIRNHVPGIYADIYSRYWSVFIRRNNLSYLLLQASNGLSLNCLPRSHHLHAR